jgi:hypothetical protein
MTVKELVEGLLELDQNKEVVFFSYIETGRGGSWIEVENFDVEDHDELDNTYRISISGDEDEDGGYD